MSQASVRRANASTFLALAVPTLALVFGCSEATSGINVPVEDFPASYNKAIDELGGGLQIAAIANDDEYCVMVGVSQNCGVWTHPDGGMTIGWNPDSLLIDDVALFGDTSSDAGALRFTRSSVAIVRTLSGLPIEEAQDVLAELIVMADLSTNAMPTSCLEMNEVRYFLLYTPPALMFMAMSASAFEEGWGGC